MKLLVQEVVENSHDFSRKVIEENIVEGETINDCFKAAYSYERRLRYCNGHYIQFENGNKEIYEKYVEWKQTGVTMSMFYGNGTVD